MSFNSLIEDTNAEIKHNLPPANEVWGKVIFSQACVKNSVHSGGGVVSQHCIALHCRWYPSMPCSGSLEGGGIPACLAGVLARGVSRPHTQGGS